MSRYQTGPTLNTRQNIEAQACALLLRSVHLSVSQVLDLMDVSDAEFREMLNINPTMATLLERRRVGDLEPMEPSLTECPACSDWFVPYASARYCSDECAKVGVIRNEPGPARRFRLKNSNARA
ncbi:MAG: hypothetical protein O7B25_09790 [Gammaproteobacteria bacterium]|nr:hypothetical protein [Gammaproteobacteria bacterium]